MKKYSRQREVIFNIIKNTTAHPTVNSIYQEARREIPNISLGTVYRNITSLAESGDIKEITVGDGFQHFDGDVGNHMHFHCTECGKIYDCDIPENTLKQHIEEKLGCTVTQEKTLFDGICKTCLRKI